MAQVTSTGNQDFLMEQPLISFDGDSGHDGDPYHSFRDELQRRIRRVDQLFGRWEDALQNTNTARDRTFAAINTGGD